MEAVGVSDKAAETAILELRHSHKRSGRRTCQIRWGRGAPWIARCRSHTPGGRTSRRGQRRGAEVVTSSRRTRPTCGSGSKDSESRQGRGPPQEDPTGFRFAPVRSGREPLGDGTERTRAYSGEVAAPTPSGEATDGARTTDRSLTDRTRDHSGEVVAGASGPKARRSQSNPSGFDLRLPTRQALGNLRLR